MKPDLLPTPAFLSALLALLLLCAPAAMAASPSEPAEATASEATPSDADAGDEAFFQRAAICAAAMEIDQLALVARARAGATGLRPDIVHLTQLGFTYVGTAYKKGLRNPRADAMLKAARSEEKGWPASRHTATVAECRKEAQALYQDATSIEQWLVTKRANSRTDKFLAAPATAQAASAASR